MSEEHAQAIELEGYKARIANNLEHYKAEQAVVLAATTLLGNYGVLGVRSLFLFNGGAVVSVLTLVGHLWTAPNPNRALAGAVAGTLHWFIWGVVAAFIATALAYGSQVVVVDFRKWKRMQMAAECGRVLCLCACAVSLVLLVVGAMKAANAMNETPARMAM